jgi:hypothetical protein
MSATMRESLGKAIMTTLVTYSGPVEVDFLVHIHKRQKSEIMDYLRELQEKGVVELRDNAVCLKAAVTAAQRQP